MKLVTIFLSIIFFTGCKSLISKDAAAEFSAKKETVTVKVYPVRVIKGNNIENDFALAQELAGEFKAFSNLNFVQSADSFSIPFQWRHNQAKMMSESARGFSSCVAKADINTDYALMVEILGNKEETWIVGVHYYLCNKKGEIVKVGLNNSHWDTFKQINPTNRQGGMKVAVLMISEFFKTRK